MLGISLIPILISGAASTLIDLQRDTTQVENLLTLVSNTTSEQISDWLTSIGDELEPIQSESLMSWQTLNILIRFTPTEAPERKLRMHLKQFAARIANSDYYPKYVPAQYFWRSVDLHKPSPGWTESSNYEAFTAALINQKKLTLYLNSFGIAEARLFIPLHDEDGVTLAVLMADLNFDSSTPSSRGSPIPG